MPASSRSELGRLLGELAQVDLARLVRAVLAPHDRVHGQLGLGRPAAEDLADPRVLVLLQARARGTAGARPACPAPGRRCRSRPPATPAAAASASPARPTRSVRAGSAARSLGVSAPGRTRRLVRRRRPSAAGGGRHAGRGCRRNRPPWSPVCWSSGRPARPRPTPAPARAGRGASARDVKKPRPSSDGPVSSSTACSGWGMMPTTLPASLRMAAMSRMRAVGVAADVPGDDPVLGLQLVQRAGVGDVAALAVLDRDHDLLARRERVGPGRCRSTGSAAAGPGCGNAGARCGSARPAAGGPRTGSGSRCRCRAPAGRPGRRRRSSPSPAENRAIAPQRR